MKTTAVIAMAGYTLAWTACAAQPAGNITSQFQRPGRDAGDDSATGWFGIYHPRGNDPADAGWPPVSHMRRFSAIDTPDFARASQWLEATGGSPVFTVGYAWRRMKLEGSAFSGRDRDQLRQPEKDSFKLDSTATRLSYTPTPNWSFQLSRGTLSGLDQLEPNEDIRRTTVSATYNNMFHKGNWRTTIAWGRNARKTREPVMGYLLESTLHFSGTHAVFGRLEQVGGDESVRQNEAAQSRVFKLRRLTVGYYHNLSASDALKCDVGAFASRYSMPSAPISPDGGEPASLMLFLRLKFQ